MGSIRLKIFSFSLSFIMCVSVLFPAAHISADETSAPSETQKTEEIDKKTSKETEKSAKEAKKSANKGTEKKQPAETEKPVSKDDKKETLETTKNKEPAVTDRSEEKETAEQEPTETQPVETEKKEPVQKETKGTEETTEQKPEETEKQIPTQTEKQEPVETEKQTPSETKPQETEQFPEETAVPSESGPVSEDKKKAKNAYSGTCGANINWTLDNSGTLTIIGSGAMYDYDYEDSLRPWDDYTDSIKKVVVSGGVTKIGEEAFSYCSNLTSVSLPSGLVTIGDSAFTACDNLTSISIPASVTKIGEWAFGESGLTSISIPSSVTTIGHGAFMECKALKNVTMLAAVKTICSSAFQGCESLTKITFNSSVKEIEEYAFEGCYNLETVLFSGNVVSIGNEAFACCEKLSSINFPDSLEEIGYGAFQETSIKTVSLANIRYIGHYAFSGCVSLTSVVIAGNISDIEDDTFNYCTNLKTITIPASIKTIGDWAFNGCSKLTDVYYRSTESDWNKVSIGKNNNPLKNATIHFEGSSYTLSLGNITNGSATLSSYSAKTGDTITVNTTPDYGYTLDVIKVNGTAISGKQFTMPASDVVVEVLFKRVDYTITLNPTTNGTASLSKTSAKSGELITVTVTPNTGYTLDVIRINNTNISGNTFTMPTMNVTVDVIFKKINYTVTLTVGDNGTAGLSKTSANYGDEITVTTASSTGYVLDTIKVNGTAISGNKFTMPAKNTTVDVTFKKATYTISLSSVTNGTANLSKTSAYYGDEITVTTTPSTGYILDTIKVNGTAISGNKFTMPAKNTTVEVTFKKVTNTYPISLSSVSNGRANLSKTTAAEGEEITVTVTPDTGYTLDSIKVNGATISGNTFIMPAHSTTVEVTFKKADYTVTLADIDPETGSASLSRNEACAGDEVVITVNPARGYELDTISVNGETLPQNVVSFIMPDKNVTVIVSYKKAIYYIRIELIYGSGKASLDKYAVSVGEIITVTATPNIGYKLDKIEVDGNPINGTSFVMEAGNPKVVVFFSMIDYKVTIKHSAGGTAFVKKNTARFDELVSIHYHAEPGYELDKITVNGNEIKFSNFKMVAENVEIVVTFKVREYYLSITCNGNNGTVNLSQNYAVIGDEIIVETKPDEGYYAIIEVNGNAITGNTFTLSEKHVIYDVIFISVSFANIDPLPVGEVVILDNFEYKVTVDPTDTGCGSVMLTKTVDTVGETVVVPSVVSAHGVDYKVTGIANNAFANNPNLTTLVIGNNVSVIGASAFQGCKKLVKVSGGARVKTIGSKAFASCPKLSSFTITSPYLAKIGAYAFSGDSRLKTIYIKNTTKLSKKGVKKALKGSKVKTVKVKKSKVKKYKKYFKKSNSGRNVKVKK